MAMADSLAALKSSVYAVQVDLLEGITSEYHLRAAGKVLTQSEYADVVTERTIANICGYPLCKRPLPESFPHRGRYHISLREHTVYDLQETKLFCSSDCLVSSQSFAASLDLERDHAEKTIELASSFLKLKLRDADHHQTSSLAKEIKEDAPAHNQELDLLCHQQTRFVATEIGEDTRKPSYKQELDPPSMAMVDVKGMATEQSEQLDPGAPLFIREQNEIKVDDFSSSGPPDAIEGYIPQREFRHNKLSDHKAEKAIFSPRHESNSLSKEDCSDFSRRKERERNGATKKKLASSSKGTDSIRRTSRGMETEFTSSILVDQGNPSLLEAKCLNEPANSFTSCIVVDEKSSTRTARQRRSGKQNRVSWADHNNLKLVEEAAATCIASTSGTSEGSRGARVSHIKESDRDKTPKVVVVEESSELLPSHEGSRCEEERDNLECAKALVAALTEAAEAVAHGEANSSEAVARAGISILSKDEVPPDQLLDFAKKEMKDSDKGLADEENVDPRDCWYSAPPKDFKPELSTFGTLWMALDGWISAASIAHVYGKDINEENDFAFINGKEYLSRVSIPNGVSAEIERTVAGCISRALPGLVETFRFPIALSTVEQSLGRFLRTMSFVDAIPPFNSKQWQVVVLLLLHALSVHRLPALRTRFLNGRQLLQKVLDSSNLTEAEYEVFRDLVLPLGMLPEYAAHCGG
eukprot:c25335_g1_i1 orf=89-2179(+)